MNYYEFHCERCGGFVGEPMKPYGYAGQWCHCAEPVRPVHPPKVTIATTGTVPNKHTPDIEDIVEEFGLWARTPANPDEEMKPFVELAQDWLRTTLKSQANQYETEKGDIFKEILLFAPGLMNIQTREVTHDLGVMEYMARIESIAQKYGVDLSE